MIFDDKEAAERAIAASPLKVPISQPQPQPQVQPAHSPLSAETPSSAPYPDSAVRNPDIAPATQEMICTIEPDTHTEAMITSRTMFNVYTSRKRDNHILNDLEGPETNIPLPQLADTIRREGVDYYDKKRKPDPNAPTLMELYREGARAAADAKNRRSKIVTLEEMHKSHQQPQPQPQPQQQPQPTARVSGLKQLAKKKNQAHAVED